MHAPRQFATRLDGALSRAVMSTVEFCRKYAVAVALLSVVLTGVLGAYAASALAVDTDTEKLISVELPWRQREAEFDRAFPQRVDLIAIVIDAATADQAEDATAALTARLSQHPDLFKSVRRPDGGAFFTRNGLLFLSTQEVRETVEQLIDAQPLLGTLAADPSLRGVFTAIDMALQGVEHGEITLESLAAPLSALADTTGAALSGHPRPLSWQTLLTGQKPQSRELRRFVLVQPRLDFTALKRGGKAEDMIRSAAEELHLTPEHGIRVRLTGPVVLDDEEFATVSEGAGGATALSAIAVCIILFMALRSWRIIAAILATLVVGLVATAAFAAAAVGSLNLISVAFAVLFIGIAVDFSIQVSIRYRDERFRENDFRHALGRAGAGIGGPLALAAGATAIGFLSFVPNAYSGVSELGIIAGTGMLIAFLCNITVLPAMLTLLSPPGEKEPVGYARAMGIDDFLIRRRREVIAAGALLGAIGLAAAPQLRFDFNPLNLKNPDTESVATLFDLMKDPDTTPYTIDVLAPSVAEADAIARRLNRLPEVSQTVTVSSYVPEEQEPKLALIQDAAMLLGPTFTPPKIAPKPNYAATLKAIRDCADRLKTVLRSHSHPAASKLAKNLQAVLYAGPGIIDNLSSAVTDGLDNRLESLRLALTAEKVTPDDLPPELRRAWVTPDGRARIEVFPKGDARDNAFLRRFVAAIRHVVPDASGMPVAIQESGATVVDAFIKAGVLALAAISILLLVILRRLRDIALVLAPLLLAGLLTVTTSVVLDLPLNFANIIALPLLLGIGVAFDIYFVMRWRAGLDGPLQSSTARAILFSALTTTSAFGSLAISSHPGTADMGKLLTIALGYTLLCTLFFLPSLLGPVRREAVVPVAAAAAVGAGGK